MRFQLLLKHPELAFEIRSLDLRSLPDHLYRQFYGDTGGETRFHCVQVVAVSAESADQISGSTRVTLVLDVAAFAGVKSGPYLPNRISGQKKPNLLARPIAVREKARLSGPQIADSDTYQRIGINLSELRPSRHDEQRDRDHGQKTAASTAVARRKEF